MRGDRPTHRCHPNQRRRASPQLVGCQWRHYPHVSWFTRTVGGSSVPGSTPADHSTTYMPSNSAPVTLLGKPPSDVSGVRRRHTAQSCRVWIYASGTCAPLHRDGATPSAALCPVEVGQAKRAARPCQVFHQIITIHQTTTACCSCRTKVRVAAATGVPGPQCRFAWRTGGARHNNA